MLQDMVMDPNRWTLKTQEAVNAAVTRATADNNPEVTPDHLLVGLLSQSLGQLDIIIEQRQTAWVFLKVIVLAMPQLLNLILPIAVFVAAWFVTPSFIAFRRSRASA